MTINRGPITDGVDFNFFKKVVINRTTFGGVDGYDADVFITIRGSLAAFTMVNYGPEIVEYSFNGNTLHGDMVI